MRNFFGIIKHWFKSLADWIQENLGDPVIAAALRDDLGLAPGEDIPAAKRDQIQQYAQGLDPDKQGFRETIQELQPIIEALSQLGDQMGWQELEWGNASGWDVAYLIGNIAASESIRLRFPTLYALGKLTRFITSDPSRVSSIDPASWVPVVHGDLSGPSAGESSIQRRAARIGLGVQLLDLLLSGSLNTLLGPNCVIEALYGWDASPDSASPNSDLVSERTMTILIRREGDDPSELALTFLEVPREHSGPGLLVALGGTFTWTQDVDATEDGTGDGGSDGTDREGNASGGPEEIAGRENSGTKYSLEARVPSCLILFIPFRDSALPFKTEGNLDGYLRIGVLPRGQPQQPAFRIRAEDQTHVDVAGLGYGIELSGERAAFRLVISGGELVIRLGEGDGFLQQLPQQEIRATFNLAICADTQGGLRIEGGTLLRATVPVERAVEGGLAIHSLDLALGPGSQATSDGPGYDVALELATAVGLNLGPFRATVDRIGLLLEIGLRKGNLGPIDAKIDFKPPSGIGIVLDAGIIKGSGYLLFDHERREYAGALELKFQSWGLGAIGILSTQMPDGSSGYALLLLVYANLPRLPIGFGLFLEGVGGIIGLQHGYDIAALQNGLSQGYCDDLLFPANPVADAVRIIDRLRVIFPIRPSSFLIGLFFRLTWGTPATGEVKLGLMGGWDNATASDRSWAPDQLLVLGQVRIGLPKVQSGKVARLVCDFLAYLDFGNKRFGFYARLRNSKLIDALDLAGSLFVQVDYGENPATIVAAGGFHPDFRDLPADIPRLDRIQLAFNIQRAKITSKLYFAVTPATIQFGMEVQALVKLGSVEISAMIGIDALIYPQEGYQFKADFRTCAIIKVSGKTLLGVDLNGRLTGPELWHVSGKVKFTLLLWDVEESFDEQWGEQPQILAPSTNVAALLRDAYNDISNWSAPLPSGTDALVRLAAPSSASFILAHPLSQLRVSQKVAPLGLTLEKFGETRVDGPNCFELREVRIGDTVIENPPTTKEYLARGQYVNLTEEERLTQPSFERFEVGVSVGASDFRAPRDACTTGDLGYETQYLEPGTDTATGALRREDVSCRGLDSQILRIHALVGAAAQSRLREYDALRSNKVAKIALCHPSFAVVDQINLGRVGQIALCGIEQTNLTLAIQRMRQMRLHNAQIVEEYELS